MSLSDHTEQPGWRVFRVLKIIGRGLIIGVFAVFPFVLFVAFVVGAPIAYILAAIVTGLTGGESAEQLADSIVWPMVSITGVCVSAYLFFAHSELGKYWWSRLPSRVQSLPEWDDTIDLDDIEYPDDWEERRRKVFRRDKYRCRNCGESDVELHAHHIVPLRVGGTNKKSNLITLCRDCHELIHPHMR